MPPEQPIPKRSTSEAGRAGLFRSRPAYGVGAAMLVCVVAAAGCSGYQVGARSLYAPHVRTVYVPVIESNSYRRNLGERLTEAVMKEIEAKTPYKVVGTPNADSTLSGRIVGENRRVVVEDRYDQPRQAETRLQVAVRWTDCRGDLIRETQSIPFSPDVVLVNDTAPLFPEIGQSVATSQQQAIQRVAEQIVSMMETPW
ncbi:MAG: hypothetical protein HQ582_09615 [Planctomycetes bacterium]|nr:hypothetical protein [Planctomycetota bacterium]